MSKHGKPKWYHSVFLKTWEVYNNVDEDDVAQFRTNRSAMVYAADLNNPILWDDNDGSSELGDGSYYIIRRRSF